MCCIFGMVSGKLGLQNRHELVDFCPCRFAGIGYCIAHGELAKLEGGYTEPGGGAEV